jgi:group I intron endonuclease
MGCIYRLLCKENGKSYIGQSKNNTPDMRWKRHVKDSEKNSMYAIHQAIRKYGKDVFEVSILCLCESQEELNKKEDEYITEYTSMIYENGYNMVRGGKGRAPNFQHKEEHKKKMSEFMKNRIVTDETRQKISNARKGVKNNWDEETRLRVAEMSRKKATGVKHSEETKEKIRKSLQGKPGTSLGKKRTEEQKKNIGNASRGRKFSEDTKIHMSKKQSERWKLNPIGNKRCKFSEEDIRYIRKNPDNLTEKELGNKFNEFPYRIREIINKKIYKNVEDEVSI